MLSTGKYRRLVTLAKGLGYQVTLIYVVLDSPDPNVERVRLRVEKGGHDVPEPLIRARYGRSLEQMPWFLDIADHALIYDNSGSQPRLMAKKQDGVVTLYGTPIPAVLEALQRGVGRRE